QTNADVGTVGDLQRAHVTIEVAEDATWHSTQFRHWRVIGVDADADTQLFSDWHHLSDEIGIVFPQLFFGIFAAMRERAFEHFADPIAFRILVQVKSARRRSTACALTPAAPDAVAHMRVGRV